MPKRTTPYISQFFQRDKVAFTAMWNVGHVTKDHLKECNIAPARIKNYVRDGLVEKVSYKEKGKAKEAYKLTKAGKEFAERQWALQRNYHAQSPRHDVALAIKYFSLPEKLRETWKTESQLRDMFSEKLQSLRNQGDDQTAKMYQEMLERNLISMPDALYTNEEGKEVSYETITNNYGLAELRAKEVFVEIMKTEYQTTRV